MIFVSNTSLAASLLTPCCHNCHNTSGKQPPPALIVMGVQKGGTSTIRELLAAHGMCRPRTGELQFFNHRCFAQRPIQTLELEGYLGEWAGCHQPGFDKSPATYAQPWVPLRVCQVLPPRQRLLMMMRNPISRAFSGYHQCLKVRQFKPPVVSVFASNTTLSQDGFSRTARLEVAIARRCDPWGTGNPAKDAALGVRFEACCAAVVREQGLALPWPGCATTPHCGSNQTVPPHRKRAIELGGTFGTTAVLKVHGQPRQLSSPIPCSEAVPWLCHRFRFTC